MFSKWIDNTEREKWTHEFHDNRVVPVLEWLAMLAITMVPVVNIIMLVKWAFTSKELMPANKVNLARAFIILLTAMAFAVGIIGSFFLLGWLIGE